MDFSFESIESSWFSGLIRDSRWGFAIAEIIHLFGMVLLLGGVILMSLRLMGLAMSDRTIGEVAAEVRNWILIGLTTMLLSGISLWASEPSRMDEKGWFWFKMACLVVATAFHLTVYNRVTRNEKASKAARLLTAIFTLLLWFSVGFGGRAIGFL